MFFKDRFSLSKRRKTPQGFLEASDSRLARTGILVYRAADLDMKDRDPSSEVIIFRDDKALFAPDTIESFKSVPVTNGHPPKLLTAENAKAHAVGMMKDDIKQGGADFLTGTPIIIDKKTIEDIESGKVELSNGYEADIDFTPGVAPCGTAYHGVQTNIRGNHVAIVDRGRCGDSCAISDEQKQNEVNMETVKVMFDGVEIEMTKQGSQALAKVQSEIESIKSEKAKVLTDSATAVADAESKAEAKIDALEEELEESKGKVMDDSAIEAYVCERQELLDNAEKVTGAKFDGKGKSTTEIKKQVVATARKIEIGDAKLTDSYVGVAFDILVEDIASGVNNNKILKDHATRMVADSSGETLSQKSRRESMERNRNAYKGESK